MELTIGQKQKLANAILHVRVSERESDIADFYIRF